MNNRQAYIVGTGHSVPSRILTNADLERMVDTSDEWITTRSGIKERHISEPSQATSDLSIEAARNAMDAAGWKPGDVEAVIVGTVTPDFAFPCTAAIVANKLGLPTIPCYDFEAGCTGFIYGLIQARALILSETLDRILVIGGETLTKITNWKDRSSCVLFGDGAGAVAVSSQGPGGLLGGWHWGADGSFGSLLCQKAGGTREPLTHEGLDQGRNTIYMEGGEIFKNAVRAMRDSALLALEKEGITRGDVDLLISHQANVRIIDATARALGLPPEKVFVNIHKFGNTSSASIPIALDEVVRSGAVKPGMNLVLAAFGAGLTWGGMVLRWK